MTKNMKKLLASKQEGFTLIEILVVIGIIAILAVIVLIAINPAKQFAQSRNTQRTSNVNALSNAVGQRLADNKGVFSGSFAIGGVTYTCPDITTLTVGTNYKIKVTTPVNSIVGTDVDLGCLTPTYMSSLPFDPSKTGAQWVSAANYNTEYTISRDANSRITICAPEAANESSVPNAATICITR